MSTRATITVADEHDSFDIYQHYDGYPEGPDGLVRHLALAPKLAWDLPRFEAMDFAAAIIAVLKDRGGSTYLTKDADAHVDRAYHYRIEPLRQGVSTQVQLTIIQPSWRENVPDRVLFIGDIQTAVQKFGAVAEVTKQPREQQALKDVEAALYRAEEEISQLCGGRPDPDTRNTFEVIDDATRELGVLRHHLEKAHPWDALAAAESMLADPSVPTAKRLSAQTRFAITAAMDAHRKFQRG